MRLVHLLCAGLFAASCGGGSSPSSPSTNPSSSATTDRVPEVRTSYDVERQGVPRFAVADYVDLSSIARISKFRSSEGHSYVDIFESCRSMKHYFRPRTGVSGSTIGLYSPADGDVSLMRVEGSFGTQVHIRPTAYPAFTIIIFHVTPLAISVGTRVQAGQRIGSHVGDQTWSDVAIGVDTPTGYRLVSWFEAMTDGVFSAYQARGVGQRSDAIITRAQRDADPLGCAGETFTSRGRIESWIDLR